ncbi:penicillin acylase family protein, partial [Acinetobacter baumannii]
MKRVFLALTILLATTTIAQSPAEIARWNAEAKRVTIIRDVYGVPHIYGKTDADAVFGLLYTQCEENFDRVERN